MEQSPPTAPPSAPDAVPPDARPPVRRRRGRFGLWLLLSLAALAAVGAFALLGLTGQPIRLPVWAVAEVEARMNAVLEPSQGAVSVGAIEITVDADWVPRLRLEDLRLLRPGGEAVLTLPDTRVAFDPSALAQGQIRASSLRLIGARLMVRRDRDGRFDLAFGGGMAPVKLDSFAAVLDAADAAFAQPAMARLERIDAEGLSLTLEDARAGRTWEVGDGRLTVENRPGELAAELGLTLVGGGAAPAQAVVTFVSQKGSPSARITATVDHVAAADIAAQATPLAWLAVLDAPISGRIAAALDAGGRVSMLDGALEIGAGALRPTPESRPFAFDSAALRLGYDPTQSRVNISELTVQSPSLRLTASGHSYLQRLPGAAAGSLPDAFVTQMSFAQVMVDPAGLFVEPVRFSQGALDLRLRLNPFRIDIGQLSLVEQGRHLRAKGAVSADAAGWHAAVDVALDEIRHDRLLALWPVTLVPKTRVWLTQNVQEGLLFDVKAALRLEPGQEPRLSLGYEFANADVRFLKTLPPIKAGYGYSTVEGKVSTLVLDKGHVTAPQGGDVDMDGSVFTVPDITVQPTRAEIHLRTDSSLTAALSLLDQPPFGFLAKAGRPVDLGAGRAQLDATLSLPLVDRVPLSQISYQVTGRIQDLRSTVLVPGRVLTAPDLTLTATPAGMTIAGPGLLGAVAFDATYTLPFGPEAKGGSQVEGEVTLSQAAVQEFGIGLPAGSVSGSGIGRIALDLPRGAAPKLTLTSDLRGITLTLAPLGWTKPRGTAGKLEVTATLGSPPVIDRVAISGAGLEAAGRVTLRPGGALELARFDRLRLNGWLDASVDLVGQGRGRDVDIRVTGGSADLRRMDLGSGAGGRGAGGRGAGGPPLSVSLDEVTVSQGIVLRGFRGAFSPRGGMNGTFNARLNGEVPIKGAIVPSAAGTAVRVTADDAGAAFRAAGIFSYGRGGSLDLQLVPRGPAGDYDGRATVANVRVRNASVLAELLNAVSVVGILEQLNGEGLVFNRGEADFRLTPRAVEITRGSAVGASLGISMAGVYQTDSGKLALQGVISPIYLLNGIGAVLTRRGEGLFGFNYRLRGTADKPEVSVNPLSILTPGMFRDIFRQPAPVLQERRP